MKHENLEELPVPLVEIMDVSLSRAGSRKLYGYSIDDPSPGNQSDIYTINISGWVLGRESPATDIEIVIDGKIIRSAPVCISSKGVFARYPMIKESRNCRFQTMVSLLGTAPEFELIVRAVLKDKSKILLGIIRGRHQPLITGFRPTIQPLMITSLGRTGTTWLMRVLSEHPDIVIQKTYPFETKAAIYWIHMLKVLSEPANYLESANPDSFLNNFWWVGHNPFFTLNITNIHQLRHWFGFDYIKNLAIFCQQSIEYFYRQISDSQGKASPAYFAEKHLPIHIPWLFWDLYPQAREVFLVRDFRDMVCSMLAFNKKRGFDGFGNNRSKNKEEFIRQRRVGALRLLRNWKLRSEKSYLLRYEDLILNPEDTLRDLLEYLGLESSNLTVQDILKRASVDTPDMKTHQTSKNPRASVGRWKKEMNDDDQSLCQEVFGDILKEFGYND